MWTIFRNDKITFLKVGKKKEKVHCPLKIVILVEVDNGAKEINQGNWFY